MEFGSCLKRLIARECIINMHFIAGAGLVRLLYRTKPLSLTKPEVNRSQSVHHKHVFQNENIYRGLVRTREV